MTEELQLNDPQTLYRRWEDSQWSPFAIDLSADKEQWPGIDADIREIIYFALSSLMVAEERITTKFSGLVAAHGSEEEATFLSTQQVDEARHMQFYARFRDEVIFDQALVQAHDRLAADPRDARAKVEFVTIYHQLIEATLGHTAFEFITRYLRDNDLLPGFVEGYTNIHHDEQRHIGYGVWFLRESAGRDAELAERVRQTPRDLLPSVAAALAPPDREGTDWEALGASGEEIRDFALNGLTRRLGIVGVPLASL